MVALRRWPTRAIFIITVVLLVSDCSRTGPAAENHGGQDSGGGTALKSSPNQVRTALDRALELATISDSSKNVFVQFWKSWGRNSNKSHIQNPAHLFPGVKNKTGNENDIGRDSNEFESPALQALKHNKITRLEIGDCLKSNALKHADASVSGFTVNADICFSIGNLTKIPPSSLLREVLSLVLHESTHLGGAEEAEAIDWQEGFSAYFGARFGDLETDTVSDNTLKSLADARTLLMRAKSMASVDPKNSRIFATISKFSDELAALPFLNDPLALELKTKASRPNLIPNYSDSVLALIRKTTIRFDLKTDFLKIGAGFHVPLDFVPTNNVEATLLELGQDLEQIEENFIAFASRSNEVNDSSARDR